LAYVGTAMGIGELLTGMLRPGNLALTPPLIWSRSPGSDSPNPTASPRLAATATAVGVGDHDHEDDSPRAGSL